MKLKRGHIELPTMTRVATLQPQTLNKEERTVDIRWTTGATVRRTNFWDGVWYEELGLKKSEVRMGRLNNGAPFLDNHGFTEARGVKQVLGAILPGTAKIRTNKDFESGKEGIATVRFSKRAVAEGILDDVEDGILANVSVGYDIYDVQMVKEEDGVPTFRMTDWEPIEVSLVPAGADDDAMVRSKNAVRRKLAIRGVEAGDDSDPATGDEPPAKPEAARNSATGDTDPETGGTRSMPPTEEEIKAQKEAEAKRSKEAADKAAEEARQAEKARASGIRELVGRYQRLDQSLAQKWIDEDKPVDECRGLVLDLLAEDPEPKTRSSNGTAEVGDDLSRRGRIDGAVDALLHRFRPTSVKDPTGMELRGYEATEAARPYMFRSLSDIARMVCEANGVSCDGLPKHEVAQRALQLRSLHSISDFSEILANTVNRTLRDGYAAAPQTWRRFTRIVRVPDFKEISRTNLGDAPPLLKVNEGGEVERGTLSEEAEKYFVEEYARIVAVTRKVIVNDDLDAMTRIPNRMGRRAADLESDTIFNILKANPLMADGNALFSAPHGNLATAEVGPPDEAALAEGRTLMRRQTGIDGAEIAIVPVLMHVPPAHETVSEKLLATIIPDSSTNVSPFSSSGRTPLGLEVEPRWETGTNGSLTAWFMFASIDQVDQMELAFLEGTDGPQTMTREGFDVAGLEIKIQHDLGAKAIDYRGMFKNAGS